MNNKEKIPGRDATFALIVALLALGIFLVVGQAQAANAQPDTARYLTVEQSDGTVWLWDTVAGVRVAVFDANDALPGYVQWHANRTVRALNRGRFEP